jgi:hypothetical protein
MKPKYLREENGVALVIALLLLLVITLIGLAGVNTSVWDNLISGNVRASEQAFYVAEAGINEFMGRFRHGAMNEIKDIFPSSPNWRLFLAINTNKAGTIGYTASDNFAQSLQNQMDFRVKITHKVDSNNNVILHGRSPIYIVRSHGFTADGAEKVIEVELKEIPGIDPPGAVYSEGPIIVRGTSIYIQGGNLCKPGYEVGFVTTNKAGIVTSVPELPKDPISISYGDVTIEGNPPKKYNSPYSNLRVLADYLKTYANFKYDYNRSEILMAHSDEWGRPLPSNRSTPIGYDGPMNIVYFNMHGNTLKLSGESHGAGILLVDGNLELQEGFRWYGMIIVMGALNFTGGGENNITGGILCAGAVTIAADDVGIIYCSEVVNKLKNLGSPLRTTKWREVS